MKTKLILLAALLVAHGAVAATELTPAPKLNPATVLNPAVAGSLREDPQGVRRPPLPVDELDPEHVELVSAQLPKAALGSVNSALVTQVDSNALERTLGYEVDWPQTGIWTAGAGALAYAAYWLAQNVDIGGGDASSPSAPPPPVAGGSGGDDGAPGAFFIGGTFRGPSIALQRGRDCEPFVPTLVFEGNFNDFQSGSISAYVPSAQCGGLTDAGWTWRRVDSSDRIEIGGSDSFYRGVVRIVNGQLILSNGIPLSGGVINVLPAQPVAEGP